MIVDVLLLFFVGCGYSTIHVERMNEVPTSPGADLGNEKLCFCVTGA